jgi:probable HAF family extracellular repeat protein
MIPRVILLVLFWLAFRSLGSAETYTITDLGTLGGSYSEAHGISFSGAVTGDWQPTNDFYLRAFLCSSGIIADLGTLGSPAYALGYAINDSNQVVGESSVTGTSIHAFVYTNGALTDLGALGGTYPRSYSSGHGINRAGLIVGESSLSFGQSDVTHAVLYDGATLHDLGTLGGDYSSANGINNSNAIVGATALILQGGTNIHAFVYSNGIMQELGTLGGGYSSARAINDSGIVVGESETVDAFGVTNLHAFVYRNGTMTDLNTFGGSSSSASAIDSAGRVVGYSYDPNETSDAFLYDGNQTVSLINLIPANSGWTNLVSADGINDAGQITGSGLLANGDYHAYLLTPVRPLNVAITNPAPNASFQAPATILIGASASDTAGTVTNVQFLANSTVIGNSTSSPYSVTASNFSAGTYTLTAVASDNGGLTATNSISITVTSGSASPVTLLSPTWGGGNFSFSFATQVGFTYDAQYATPLVSSNNWTLFSSVPGNGSVVWVTNSALSDAQRYYRVEAH